METLGIILGLAVVAVAVVTTVGFMVAMSKVRAYQLNELESGN